MKQVVFCSRVLFALLVLLVSSGTALAQQTVGSLGFAEYTEISEEGILDGTIISLEDGIYHPAEVAYSTKLYGVVVEKPTVAISLIGRDGAYPVLTSGTAQVLVSVQNGAIEKGDYITSSSTPGVGVKATQAGFVIGIAQAPFTGEGGEEGQIPVTVDIKFVSSPDTELDLTPRAFAKQIQDIITVGLRAVSSEPNSALRYAAAAFVLVASLAFGFLVFGRAATNGVAAVGRNPLAKKSIFVMVVFNITMTVVFALAGVGLAVVILAL